jgi:hypothetical protein
LSQANTISLACQVRSLPKEAARGQVEDLFLLDRGIEGPIEIVEGFEIPKASGLEPSLQEPIGADHQFILYNQLQKLGVIQAVAPGPILTITPTAVTRLLFNREG